MGAAAAEALASAAATHGMASARQLYDTLAALPGACAELYIAALRLEAAAAAAAAPAPLSPAPAPQLTRLRAVAEAGVAAHPDSEPLWRAYAEAERRVGGGPPAVAKLLWRARKALGSVHALEDVTC